MTDKKRKAGNKHGGDDVIEIDADDSSAMLSRKPMKGPGDRDTYIPLFFCFGIFHRFWNFAPFFSGSP